MKNQPSLDGLIEITKEILQAKYSSAEFAFLSGSIVRGEGTPFSDLDIIVIFNDLPNAFRESFYFREFPVETFVHTPETLNYFMFEVDRPSGFPVMPMMVLEGVQVPNSCELSRKLKCLAEKCLQMKPPLLSAEQLTNLRYQITNLVEDIREPRSKEELTASASELYAVLADFYFRANGFWSAKNKSIPRQFQKVNPDLGRKFCESFEEVFVTEKTEKIIELCEQLLKPHGGFLFAGVQLDASADFRKPLE